MGLDLALEFVAELVEELVSGLGESLAGLVAGAVVDARDLVEVASTVLVFVDLEFHVVPGVAGLEALVDVGLLGSEFLDSLGPSLVFEVGLRALVEGFELCGGRGGLSCFHHT